MLLLRRYINYIAAALIITIIFATIYGTVQQSQRDDANMPQIQLAEDTAAALNQYTTPVSLTSSHIDLSSSLLPFVEIYSLSGHLITSSGYVGNTPPAALIGVLTASDGKPYSTVTWQPHGNIRLAAVIIKAHSYYVLSGRSLTEVEKNESATTRLVTFGWLISLLVLAACALQTKWLKTPK